MPSFDWDEEKNKKLQSTRNVSFEMVVEAIYKGQLLKTLNSENKRYKHQFVYLVKLNDYIYIVPFVIDKIRNIHFLKTIYPSRKATKKYLNYEKAKSI